MTPEQIVFLLASALTLFSAVMVVSVRRMFRAALWLVLSFFGVAITYALLEASFFVVVQVTVYIGAIAILIIFGVMLTRRSMEDAGPQVLRNWWLPLLMADILMVGMIAALNFWPDFGLPLPTQAKILDIASLGAALVNPSGYMIPFELASVLLIAAMIGSIYIAIDRKGGRG